MLIPPKRSRGFTIIELLIVIVIIAILAAITLVAYNSVQSRAKTSAVEAALSQVDRKVKIYQTENGAYPASLSDADVGTSSTISYQYQSTSSSYCVTAMIDGAFPYHISDSSAISSGPCDGQSGGTTYCPTDSFVPINGYYCDGTEGAVASLNSSDVKLASSASGVPSGAPGAYVGRQSTRDNLMGSSFSVTPGDVYCISGWVATTASTVTHALGLQVTTSDGTRSWPNGGAYTAPTSTWTKLSGCITIPANAVSAIVWSQNNGTNGTTAADYWYQAAIKLTKQ